MMTHGGNTRICLMVKPNPEDARVRGAQGNRRVVEKLERLPTARKEAKGTRARKEAKGARAAAEGMENEVCFLGLAILEDPPCASQP